MANPAMIIPSEREYVWVRVSIRRTLENVMRMASLLRTPDPSPESETTENFPSLSESVERHHQTKRYHLFTFAIYSMSLLSSIE
jgi:hypothetical protein